MNLAGTRVVVTRQAQRSGGLSDLLTERRAEVIELPTIAVEPPADWGEVDDSIRALAAGEFDWVAFTSVNGVEKFFGRLGCMPDEVFRNTKVAAVGTTTRSVLNERGVSVDLVPGDFTGVALADALGTGAGKILLPRAADVPGEMVEILKARGWETHSVATYRTVPVAADGPVAERVAGGDFDVVTFTSASTVRGFAGMFRPADLGLGREDRPERIVACIGPVTAQQCTSSGLRVDVVATEHTAEGLVEALTMAPLQV